MTEAVKLKEGELKDYLVKTMTPLLADSCGKLVAEQVDAAIKKAFEDRQAEFEKGIPDFLRKAQETSRQPKTRGVGEGIGRYLRAFVSGKNTPEGTLHWLKRWGDDDLVKICEDAWTKDAMMATNMDLGGVLIPSVLSMDYTELLRPASIVRRLGAVVLSMPSGNYEIPKVTQGSTAYYQEEGGNITPSKLKTGVGRLIFKKLTALVPVSNDLVRLASVGADQIVRDDLIRAQSQRENQAFLRDDGTLGGPKGLLYWCAGANKFAANGTVSLANTVTDLGKMVLKLMNNNIPMTRPAWMFSPQTWNYLMTVQNGQGFFSFRDEMQRGTLWGWPFAMTTAIPTTEMYLVDMADTVIGESLQPRVDASTEAAYHDGTNVVAAFSKDQTVIRVIAEHDFLCRREESISVLTGVTWGA